MSTLLLLTNALQPSAEVLPRGVRGAELARMDDPLRRALLDSGDADQLQSLIAEQPGYVPVRAVAESLIGQGVTDAPEVDRVLGPHPSS